MRAVPGIDSAARHAAVAVISCILMGSFIYVSGMVLNVDETFHYPQIASFLRYDFRYSPALTMLPGYHFTVFAVASVLGADSVLAIRFISFSISLLSIAAFHLLARHLREQDADGKTLQFVFLPLLYPFFFLIYTDVASLLPVFAGIYLTLKKRHYAAGLCGLVACLFRQNSIVWVGFMFLLMALDARRAWSAAAGNEAVERGSVAGLVRTVVKDGAAHLACFALFVVFVVVNKGFAVGDTDMYPSTALHFGNVYSLLFTFFFLFLPMNLANAGKIVQLLRRHRLAALYAVGFYAFFMATFRIDHPYNTEAWAQWFVSNQILGFFQQSPVHRTLFFLPVLWSVLSLLCVRLYAREYYLIYPLSVVFLLPLWHVDPRYFLVPLVLFLLFKEEDSRFVRWSTYLLYLAACAYFLRSIVTYAFFF